MSNDVLIVAEHSGGELSDATFELLGKGRELAGAWGGQCAVALLGDPGLAGALGAADLVLTMEHAALAAYTPEAYEHALAQLIEQRQPRLVLVPNTTLGMDLGAGLSAAWQAPLVAYVVDLASEDGTLVATSQVYGGKLLAEAVLDGDRAVCTVVAGSFPAGAGRGGGGAATETVSPPAALDSPAVSFVELREPEAGDVDIGAADLLVSVGRGIGNGDDIELVQELADALGAALSASRPVTDKGWLPKTRQVGKSGLKVKPKLYLAFGISGAPEHLEGMRDAELIIACNTDPHAPIFDVAHYGTTEDLFDLVPALTEKLAG
jgi:electron transfer flavoprotein alpha subunit